MRPRHLYSVVRCCELFFKAPIRTRFAQLADEGGRAFVSQSLRPYLLAALLDRDPSAPAIVVAGDDRAARDLAADLRRGLRRARSATTRPAASPTSRT